MEKDAVIFEGSNEVRNSNTLELLGYYFEVDGVRYFASLQKHNEL